MLKSVIVGFDAFDPNFAEKLFEQGKLPHLGQMVTEGKYRRFAVANPPQSEVSWTSIATGLNPGGHGLFDFVHRNPKSYALTVSLLPMKSSPLGPQFVPPYNTHTIFDEAVDDGYDATVMWWPAMFPARIESPVRVFPGLGVPDIQGRLGVGTYFSQETDWKSGKQKSDHELLESLGSGRYQGFLRGPIRKSGGELLPSSLQVGLEVISDQEVRLTVGKESFVVKKGEWSPIVEVSFKMGLLVSIKAITRLIVTDTAEPKMYALPLQMHPLKSLWRYASPGGFVKETWKTNGPFLTLGWPQDTTALEDGCINEDQFLDLCESIIDTRMKIFKSQLGNFNEGILATVFDTLDRVQHMFWKSRPDVIEQWYLKLDTFAGEVRTMHQRLGNAQLLFVSDHGFTHFDYKMNVNRWLVEKGYLVPKTGATDLSEVDWAQSKAYAIGLNSLYLNLAGREGQGSIAQEDYDREAVKIQNELMTLKGPDGKAVFNQVQPNALAFEGKLAGLGPDLVLGFAPGYRASAETGTGKFGEVVVEPNTDKWNADHCIDPNAVHGVLFADKGLDAFEKPSYRDIPALVLGKSIAHKQKDAAPPPTPEDDAMLEERLKGLGYL